MIIIFVFHGITQIWCFRTLLPLTTNLYRYCTYNNNRMVGDTHKDLIGLEESHGVSLHHQTAALLHHWKKQQGQENISSLCIFFFFDSCVYHELIIKLHLMIQLFSHKSGSFDNFTLSQHFWHFPAKLNMLSLRPKGFKT